jgi:hypothetical protein
MIVRLPASRCFQILIETGPYARELGIDCLALIACLMFPRLVVALLCALKEICLIRRFVGWPL